jgi:hypothetical protein
MGRMFVDSMEEMDIAWKDQVAMHLQYNCYPPVPLIMLDTCIEAIAQCVLGDHHVEIDLPEGVSYRGLTTAPAHAIVSNHRLEAFIEIEVMANYLEMMGE